jgi:hypothetical protein
MARKLEQKYSFGGTNHEYRRNKNLGRGIYRDYTGNKKFV